MARKKESREFVVKGPYHLQFNERGMIGNEEINHFFADAANELMTKHGVYVFAVRHGQSYTPYYVGKTQNSFKAEVFNSSNKRQYEAVNREHNGKTVIFLLVPSDEVNLSAKDVGRVSKNRSAIIKEIEEYFIRLAACANPKLINTHKAKGPEWSIKGVLNADQGNPGKDACLFKSMFKGVDWTMTPKK